MFSSIYPANVPAGRASSRAKVLWMVRTQPGISRAEIAQESGLSKAAISATVADLLDTGLLVEAHTLRRRIGLHLNHQAGLALGVEISSEHRLGVLVDLSGQALRSVVHSAEVLALSDAVRDVAAVIKDLLPAPAPSGSSLIGLGVSVPGLVDAAGEAALLFAPAAWAGEAPLVPLLHEQLGWDNAAPVTLINTYHAGALGEHRNGAGQGTDDLIFVDAGDSIGAGFVLAGELYLGSSSSAGDVGHIAIDPAGPLCTCGNRGCLEALAGGPAVIDLARRALKEQARDHLLVPHDRNPSTPGPGLTLQDVIEAALAGDLAALTAVRQAGEYMGLAIAGLVNALNPQRVVVGGKLAETGDTLIAPLRQAILRRATPAAYSTVEIVPAALGQEAAAIGAAALATDHYLLAYD